MNSIIHLAGHPRQNRLKKSLTPQSFPWKSLFPLTREDNAHFLRVRTENANSEIIADPMRPKNSEWIGMRAGENRINLICGQTGYFKGAHEQGVILEPLEGMRLWIFESRFSIFDLLSKRPTNPRMGALSKPPSDRAPKARCQCSLGQRPRIFRPTNNQR